MKKLVALSALSAAMLSSMTAHAATAELKLIGTITPSACVPNFTGGSTINYGNIPASTLNAAAQTNLPDKTTTISVVCDAPVKFALRTLDERAATAVNSIAFPGSFNTQKFGFGSAPGGVNIGAYVLQMNNGTSDRGPVTRMASSDGGTTWNAWSGFVGNNGVSLVSWNDGVTPNVLGAHTSITADVSIFAAIDRASNLPLTSEIPIDGLATFEVVYL